jgi:hypothetical protein
MAGTVKFEVSADVAQAVNAVLKVFSATGKVADGFDKAGAASGRAARKMEADAKAIVSRVRGYTGSDRIQLSQTQRRDLATGGIGAGNELFSSAVQRRMLAGVIRDRREAERVRRSESATLATDVARGIGAYDPHAPMAREAALFQHDVHIRRRWQRESAVRAGRERQAQAEADREAVLARDVDRGVRRYDPLEPMAREAALFAHDQHTRRRWGRETAVRQGRQRQQDLRDMEARTADVLAEDQAGRAQRRRDVVHSGILAGGTAIAAGFHFVAESAEHYRESLQKVGDANVAFAEETRGLIGLGDNAKNQGRVRDDVLAWSAASGRSRAEVADTIYNLQSAASNLSGSVQSDVLKYADLISRTKGGAFNTNAMMLTKGYQNFGGQFGSVGALANWAARLEEKAVVNFDELSTLMPDVMPVAKQAKVTPNELAAGLTVITQTAGKNEKAFTGFRNAMLRLSKAEEEGIHLTGTFTSKLEQLHAALAKMSDQQRTTTLQKIFGEETITYAAILLDKIKQFRTEVDASFDKLSDPLFQKFVQKSADAQSRDAAIGASVTQLSQNADVVRAKDAVLRNQDLSYKLADIGYEASVPTWIKAITPSAVKALRLADQTGPSTPGNEQSNFEWRRLALEQLIGGKLQTGTPQDLLEGNLLKLKYGTETGTHVGSRLAGEADAQKFAELSVEIPGLKFGDFVGYEDALENNAGLAPRKLARARYNAARSNYSDAKTTAEKDGRVDENEQRALQQLLAKQMQAAEALHTAGQALVAASRGAKARNLNTE